MKILINVVNARNVGGGLQVVQNFLLGTQKYNRKDIEWFYAVSECLDEVYLNEVFKTKAAGHYFVYPNQPDFRHTYFSVQNKLRELESWIDPDVIYTILGPGYNFFKHREVVRFANAWSTNSNRYAWSTLHGKTKLRFKLYGVMERFLLRRAKFLITQSEIVQQGLHRVTKLPLSNICVVHNVLPDIYRGLPNSKISSIEDFYEIAAVGGQMPHKNLELIPFVLKCLSEKHGIDNVRFHTTLPNDSEVWRNIESKLKSYGFVKNVLNHGKMTLEELSEMYRRCDFAFLPSVLETFSASTLEAMHFNLNVVASDLPFNSEVLGDSALYYEPMNADAASDKISLLITNQSLQQSLSLKMSERIKTFVDFEKYFNDTVDYLEKVGLGILDK